MNSQSQLTETIPEHLLPFISDQHYDLYTAIDHAAWRYILNVSRSYLKDKAQQKYLDGLKETGISTDRIPKISEIDHCLRKFGWRAVGVVGFIPPAVFMEFQSLGILPIACDMRQIDHISYTPAPDIVHEAAGHAPIIADLDYAKYLRSYGEVSKYAIISKKDMRVYYAIRKLSDVKENSTSTEQDIQNAQKELDQSLAELDYVSEATYLARMNWWTVEYGLIGSLDEPKIYGAGLLSSIGESYHCLSQSVKKIPLTLDCINMSYDITRPQPQLFVVKSFEHLSEILEEFADLMAFRKGGSDGLSKAKLAETVTTSVYDSGIQISGVLKDFYTDDNGLPFYLQYTGPTQLSYDNKQIKNHGALYHKDGFGSPVGLIEKTHKDSADLTLEDLENYGFKKNQKGTLKFQSGVVLKGILENRMTKTINKFEKNILLTFKDCEVTFHGKTLFDPSWGVYDMACGGEIVSVFGNAADRAQYMKDTGQLSQSPSLHHKNYDSSWNDLVSLYEKVRKIRDNKSISTSDKNQLIEIFNTLRENHSRDWLLSLEIFELTQNNDVKNYLLELSKKTKELEELITRGLKVVS